jgi:hypothetical protein
LDQKVTKDFLTSFTFVVNSFGNIENDIGGFGLVCGSLDGWAPFHSKNESYTSNIDVNQKAKELNF